MRGKRTNRTTRKALHQACLTARRMTEAELVAWLYGRPSTNARRIAAGWELERRRMP